MEKIQKSTLQFLSDILIHNDREWFTKNRESYDNAKLNFEIFVQTVIDSIAEIDPIFKGLEAKSCTYRINRDIRFSNDKTIYKTHFGAFVVRGGKKNADRFAGYYIHIEPGKSIIAGGAYMPPPLWLKAIRDKIDEDPNTLLSIINKEDFKRFFGTLDGEKLKTSPKGFPRDHPSIELLKYKSYLAVNEIPDKIVLSSEYSDHVMKVIEAMKPLNDYLNDTFFPF